MSRLSLQLAHRDNVPLALGCTSCETLGMCGGLHTSAGIWDCDSYCRCADKSACQLVCRNKPDVYIRREREVNGFELTNIPHAPALTIPDFPRFVPLIYGHSGLRRPIPGPAAAIQLDRLFFARTGLPRFRNERLLRHSFRLGAQTKLVISGVSRDQRIEWYWERARHSGFLDWLATVKPALVTVPNFSLFNDVPREDNLHAMKRIAICWQELAARGVPAALHLNGRTHRDWQRWGEFLAAYPEVSAVAFEFATGAVFRGRGRWHSEQLSRIARRVGRPLTLIVRGGTVHLPYLTRAFSRVVFLSGTPYVKTMKRKRFDRQLARWFHHPTAPNESLDDLLRTNIASVAAHLNMT